MNLAPETSTLLLRRAVRDGAEGIRHGSWLTVNSDGTGAAHPHLMAIARIVAAFAVGALTACSDAPDVPDHLRIAGAEPARGRALIRAYGCGTCHRINGVHGARGTVGPSLDRFAQRSVVAGILPNTPRVLVAWLIDPPAIDPRTAMPAMGLDEANARDIAAYLYTLGAAGVQVYPSGGPPLDLSRNEHPDIETLRRSVAPAGPDFPPPPAQ
jgi:mono/diheme cytochrome c family protein